MSAVHLQHIHFEATLKARLARRVFPARARWWNELQNEMRRTFSLSINICSVFQRGVKDFYSTANRTAERRRCSILTRLNLQSKQWIINKMSYWLIDLLRTSKRLPVLYPHTHTHTRCFNSSHNNSPDCDSHISRLISHFSPRLWKKQLCLLMRFALMVSGDCFVSLHLGRP